MLAGLIFAQEEAEDRPDRLIATLPFAGATLIEHHARQLVNAGAAQVIVVANQLPPELLGALSRVARLGVAVDTVRSATEAASKLHPLSRVLMLADGLVATDKMVAALAKEGGDALLVVTGDGTGDLELLGGNMAWAGVARLQAQRVVEVAALPRDYNMQSALVRVAEQAGALHLVLPEGSEGAGHGLARGEQALSTRGRQMLSALFAGRRNWIERWVFAPAGRLALPPLVDRGIAASAVAGFTGVLAVIAAALLLRGFSGGGTLLAMVATVLASVGVALGTLRGERRAARWLRTGVTVVPLVSTLLLGWSLWGEGGHEGSLVAAIFLAILASLGERAMTLPRDTWWGSPPAYLLVVLPTALLGFAELGIGAASLYAAATLALAIEDLREQP